MTVGARLELSHSPGGPGVWRTSRGGDWSYTEVPYRLPMRLYYTTLYVPHQLKTVRTFLFIRPDRISFIRKK